MLNEENKMKDKKTNTPFAEDGQRAHVDHKTGRCQSMKEHIENIVHFSKIFVSSQC